MKATQLLSVMVATTTIAIMIIVTLLQQFLQTAQASPCIRRGQKEYSTGYHDGVVQAHRDFKTRR